MSAGFYARHADGQVATAGVVQRDALTANAGQSLCHALRLMNDFEFCELISACDSLWPTKSAWSCGIAGGR